MYDLYISYDYSQIFVVKKIRQVDDEIAHHLILGPAGEEARGEVGGPGPQLLYTTIPDWGLKRQCHEIFWPFLLHELHPSKPLSNMQAKLVLQMDSFSPKYI